MKNLKKLTYNERKLVEENGLNPDEWRKEKVLVGYYIQLRNPETNSIKILSLKKGE